MFYLISDSQSHNNFDKVDFGLFRYLLFYILHARTVAPGGFRGFQTPAIFQTQLNLEKNYYKCIPLCSCVCFELSF